MGLITQVSWTLDQATRDLMEKVRSKLQVRGRNKKLSWTDDEKLAFKNLKTTAAEAMDSGIKRMVKQGTSSDNPLMLTSDWS